MLVRPPGPVSSDSVDYLTKLTEHVVALHSSAVASGDGRHKCQHLPINGLA